MSSASSRRPCRFGWAHIAALAAAWLAIGAGAPVLRVCADPNNMPFSNRRGDGFENKIAAVVASGLHRQLAYFWLPQRRGFVRNSLDAGRCDLVIGVPAGYGRLQPTRSYYRSSYVFVSRRDRAVAVDSFDDPALRTMRIGIQLAGSDNPPAAQALAARHLAGNVRGFTLYGDYSRPDPQRDIVDAVADGRVDVAVVWGPLAGYYVRRAPVALTLRAVAAADDGPTTPFAFDIAMGVRRGDASLLAAVDGVIARRQPEIDRILRRYGVPLR
jgi:mxaJ protein